MAREDSDVSRSHVSGPVLTGAEDPPAAGAVAFGPYVMRANIRRLEREGLPVQLGDRAFDILCVLTERAGEIVANRELMARVWGRVVVGAGSLRFHINALRKVLAQDGTQAQYIKSVTRRGYTFIAPVRKATPDLTGRAAEIQEIARLLSQSRFVNLVSPGGIGKTTLTLEVAHTLQQQVARRARDERSGRSPESVAVIAVLLGIVAVK
jgi:DNA-binding winged helix-turn-helix (wHTH) protein